MIKLHQFAPGFGMPSMSNFCVKIETYLKLTGVDYENVLVTDPRKTPKGKAPFIDDQGTLVADSSFIIEHLRKTRGVDPDAALDPAQRAVARAIGKMIDEHLYFCVVYSRWVDPDGWRHMEPALKPVVPAALAFVLLPMFRRAAIANLKGQGMGKHSQDEVYALGCGDVDALADYLGDKPWLMGDEPSGVDCSAFAMLGCILRGPFQNGLKERAKARPNLVAYEERAMARFFPDYSAKA